MWIGLPIFAQADSPIVVGVIGEDKVAEELVTVVYGCTARDRPVVARKLRADEPLTGVQVLFVGRTDTARLPRLLLSSNGQSRLTVTESEDAFDLGSTINFVVVNAQVRFDIALQPAERRNVKISSRLLAVARRVRVVPT